MIGRTCLYVAIFAVSAFCTSTPFADETLYNGIVLPDEWPPNLKTFPSEEAVPPYLK